MDELKPCQEHELKIWPEYFEDVKSGAKPFEARKWDRPYAVGDILHLREYDPQSRDYTGRGIRRKISYLLDLTNLPGADRPIYGGYVVLGLCHPAPENKPLTLEQLDFEKHVHCETCQYFAMHADEEPCKHCKGAYPSRYTPESRRRKLPYE